MRRALHQLCHRVNRLDGHCRGSQSVTTWRGYATPLQKPRFGQPVHETHPHILKPGELTPGITALEYHERRVKLAKALPPNSVAVIAASDTKYRSGAVFYEFRQDPNFLYLTGFIENDAVAVIEKLDSDLAYRFHLFVRPKDDRAEVWDGSRSGVEAAKEIFNADESGDVSDAHRVLPDILSGVKTVYTDLLGTGRAKSAFTRFFAGQGTSKQTDGFASLVEDVNVKPLKPIMNSLRINKSEAEIANMRKAGQISGRAYTEAMKSNFDTEKELWAFMAFFFRMHGLDGEAYVPVVAGGTNGLSIHYVRNDDILRDGELALVDAGGEYGGYITDITRTWPINGKFSDPQRDLYDAVLKVQRSCVSLCREDANMTLDKIHGIAESGLRDGLKGLGFDISGNAMDTLFPHHVGHHVGLDVHDAPGYPRTDPLKQRQCITIEPGVYVPDDERWPKHFRGMAIRIEDSVCIDEENPFILTTEAVKEIADIEALRKLI